MQRRIKSKHPAQAAGGAPGNSWSELCAYVCACVYVCVSWTPSFVWQWGVVAEPALLSHLSSNSLPLPPSRLSSTLSRRHTPPSLSQTLTYSFHFFIQAPQSPPKPYFIQWKKARREKSANEKKNNIHLTLIPFSCFFSPSFIISIPIFFFFYLTFNFPFSSWLQSTPFCPMSPSFPWYWLNADAYRNAQWSGLTSPLSVCVRVCICVSCKSHTDATLPPRGPRCLPTTKLFKRFYTGFDQNFSESTRCTDALFDLALQHFHGSNKLQK